jgi:hypothetical protein
MKTSSPILSFQTPFHGNRAEPMEIRGEKMIERMVTGDPFLTQTRGDHPKDLQIRMEALHLKGSLTVHLQEIPGQGDQVQIKSRIKND